MERIREEDKVKNVKIKKNNNKIRKGFQSIRDMITKILKEIMNSIDTSIMNEKECTSLEESILHVQKCEISYKKMDKMKNISL